LIHALVSFYAPTLGELGRRRLSEDWGRP
jgi:hypothetical protein